MTSTNLTLNNYNLSSWVNGSVIGSNISSTFNFNKYKYLNGIHFYITGSSGVMYWSTNGTTLTKATGIGSYVINDIAYGNGVYIIACSNRYWYYSSDGKSWTAGTRADSSSFGSTGHLESVVYANGKFVISSSNAVGNINLSNYTITAVNTSYCIEDMLCINNVLYGTNGYFDSYLYKSTNNGTNWTKVNVPVSNLTIRIFYANNKYYLLCYDSSSSKKSYVFYSTDGTTYNQCNIYGNSVALYKPQCIAYGNGLYLLIDYKNAYYTSKDGINFIYEGTYTDIGSYISSNLNPLTYESNKFILRTGYSSENATNNYSLTVNTITDSLTNYIDGLYYKIHFLENKINLLSTT